LPLTIFHNDDFPLDEEDVDVIIRPELVGTEFMEFKFILFLSEN
jgi:hypothetical protein